jgi:hypothetical protein
MIILKKAVDIMNVSTSYFSFFQVIVLLFIPDIPLCNGHDEDIRLLYGTHSGETYCLSNMEGSKSIALRL